jgi:hypothetical protein
VLLPLPARSSSPGPDVQSIPDIHPLYDGHVARPLADRAAPRTAQADSASPKGSVTSGRNF